MPLVKIIKGILSPSTRGQTWDNFDVEDIIFKIYRVKEGLLYNTSHCYIFQINHWLYFPQIFPPYLGTLTLLNI